MPAAAGVPVDRQRDGDLLQRRRPLRVARGAADTSICVATAQLDDLLAAVLAAPPG